MSFYKTFSPNKYIVKSLLKSNSVPLLWKLIKQNESAFLFKRYKTNENNEMNNSRIIRWNEWDIRQAIFVIFNAKCLFVYFTAFLCHIICCFLLQSSSLLLSSFLDLKTAASNWFFHRFDHKPITKFLFCLNCLNGIQHNSVWKVCQIIDVWALEILNDNRNDWMHLKWVKTFQFNFKAYCIVKCDWILHFDYG